MDTNVLTCSLSVAGVTVPQTVQAAHISPIFFPQLPLEFGSIAEEMEQRDSFIGCIADLATNGNTQGFRYIRAYYYIVTVEPLEWTPVLRGT